MPKETTKNYCEIKRDLHSNFYFSNLTERTKNSILIKPAKSTKLKKLGIQRKEQKQSQEYLDYGIFSSFCPQYESHYSNYSPQDVSLLRRARVLVGEYEPLVEIQPRVFNGANEVVNFELEKDIEVDIENVPISDELLLNNNSYLISVLNQRRNAKLMDYLEQNLKDLITKNGLNYQSDELRECQKKLPVFDANYSGTL
jgi:hypothetical protein